VMSSKIVTVEHYSSGPAPSLDHHYNHHFEQHSAATGQLPAQTFPFVNRIEESEAFIQQRQSPFDNDYRVLKNEHQKKSIQTTTTTTTTKPVLVEETSEFAVNQANVPLYSNQGNEEMYSIKIEHYPANSGFNWSKTDTYLHIFLTFFFGFFATILFFDGILRNIANFYILQHTNATYFIYIISIIFSIAYLAFTVWFMTICWRWWRNESISGSKSARNDNEKTAHKYVFIAAVLLIIGFFIFLILGILDLHHKRTQHEYEEGYYSDAAYMADLAIFIFKLVFWIIGIIATLLLSRNVLFKHLCPSKQIKIDKERPTTIYEVRT